MLFISLNRKRGQMKETTNDIIKRIICCILIIIVMSQDMDYRVWANEKEVGEIIEGEKVEYVKEHYSQKKRTDIIKRAMSKLELGQRITEEESKVIGWAYEELELLLPEEKLEWEIDHEKGIGISTYSVLTRAAVTPALIRGQKTTVAKRGVIPYKEYSDGEGGEYNIKTAVSTYSFIIPGIEQTTVGSSVCKKMVPQGCCYYDGYIFLTAYCQEEYTYYDEDEDEMKTGWRSVHPSVIYVLKANTQDYITTMVLPNKAHAGGITYADGYIWVADTGTAATGCVYYYNYSEIKDTLKYIESDSSVTAIDLSKISNGSRSLGAGNKASFLCTYNGYVCVGEYYKGANYLAKVYLYTPYNLRTGGAATKSVGTIPGNANGMVFYTAANKTYLLINTNEGYYSPSFAYVYEVSSANTIAGVNSYKKRLELPCMIEEAFIYNGRVYFVFESAAYKYGVVGWTNSINAGGGPFESVIGEVCSLTTTFVFK